MIIAVVSCRTAPWVPTVSFADRIAIPTQSVSLPLLVPVNLRRIFLYHNIRAYNEIDPKHHGPETAALRLPARVRA